MDASKNQHCANKTRLLQDYNRSVTDWAKAVRQLSNYPGNDHFAILLRKVDEARAKTQRAKRHMARTSPNTAARRTDLAHYITVHTHDIAFNSRILKSRAL
jgi:hypothetical protein